ncbi:MAG: hypothetical protein AAB583_03400 [Patescibacteria group bacterium]
MGFLENLNRRKEIERERWGQAELTRKREERDRTQAKVKERIEAFALFLQAKKQFDESGLRVLIDRLLAIEPKLKFVERLKEGSPYYSPEYYLGEGEYLCEVILSERTDFSKYHDNTKIYKSIGIVATHDGTIRFDGNRKKGSSVVPKNIWKNNKNVLEEDLGKAYENPQEAISRPIPYNEAPGMG